MADMFIELHHETTGDKRLISLAHIIQVMSHRDGTKTRVVMRENQGFGCKETYEEIKARLDAAGNIQHQVKFKKPVAKDVADE